MQGFVCCLYPAAFFVSLYSISLSGFADLQPDASLTWNPSICRFFELCVPAHCNTLSEEA